MKTFSTGFETSKFYIYLNLIKLFKKNKDLATHYYKGFVALKKNFETYCNKNINQARILEIGCGQRFIYTTILHTLGAQVTGIDTDFVSQNYSLRTFFKICRYNGLERAIKTFVRHYLYDLSYYQTIETELGQPLNMSNLDLRLMSACNLQFPDNHFDYIYSGVVFEHINDVDKAASETARVLKNDGIAYIIIHLWPSISGGHNLEWGHPDTRPSKQVPPWDHLRQNLFPAHAYLNKLREKDYIKIFSKYFNILEIKSQYEGGNLLTHEIERELYQYTKEELLKKILILTMRKITIVGVSKEGTMGAFLKKGSFSSLKRG